MLRRPTCLTLVLALCVGLTAGAASAQDALPKTVRAALDAANVRPDALAAVALPVGHDGVPWQHRSTTPMQPASTMKVVTSIVALDRLGPNHRGYTELRTAAPLNGGTLQGDLVLKGGADPELGIPQFWALLTELKNAGVTRIEGDLIVDRSLFRPARVDTGLPPFDEAPEFDYNVIPDALHLAGSLLPLELSSDAQQLRIRSVPPLAGLEFDTRAMALSDRPCNEWSRDWTPARVSREGQAVRVQTQGAYPKQCLRRTELQVIDRSDLTERLFRTLWAELGGSFSGRVLEATAPAQTRVLARRNARPWGEVLRHMNKVSDNAITRLLYLQLGAAAMASVPDARTSELSAREVRGWLAERAISDEGLVLDNGSGLSRSERITPLQLASMLRFAAGGRYASDLQMSLPIAGVDGTMRNRLQDSPATGWARLKTGTLRNVVALAGYVNDADGRPWAVAMMINDDAASRARPALDALVDHIARGGLKRVPVRVVGPQGEGP